MHSALLFIHFIGLGLGLGASFSFMALGIATKTMPMPEKVAFYMKAFAISKNGNIGLALLILSGIGLLLVDGPAATFAAGGGFFHAKLTFVVLLAGVVGYMNVLTAKAKRENGGPAMAKLPKLGPFGLILTLLIVLCAVLAFH